MDVDTAAIVAESLMKSIHSDKTFEKCAVGIGGTHYPQKLTRLEIESEIAIGPVVPKHVLEYFTRDILNQILQKSDQEMKISSCRPEGAGQIQKTGVRSS